MIIIRSSLVIIMIMNKFMNMKKKFLEKKANYQERNSQIELALCRMEKINEYCALSLYKNTDEYATLEQPRAKRVIYVLMARLIVLLFILKFGFTSISGEVCVQ